MILPLLARFWPYIAIAILTLGLYASVKHSGALSARLDQAIEISNANAEIAAKERAEVNRVQSIADTATQALASNQKHYAPIKRSISDAPPSDDGPISPILRRTLDGLRSPPDTHGGDKAGDDSPGASPVRGQAKPSGT